MSTKNLQKQQLSKKESSEKKSYSNSHTLVKRELLGIGITNTTEESVLEFLKNSLQSGSENYYIVTPNPEMIVLATKNADFKKALNGAKIALNDGVGLLLAAKFMGRPLSERITGVDFVKRVCEMSNDWPITVGFLGGGPKIAEMTVECLVAEYPQLHVVYVNSEWNDDGFGKAKKYQVLGSKYYANEKKIRDTKYIIHNTSLIDVLFVAFGAPKQELFMAEHLNKIPVRVMVGVGGSFDYISGSVKRAPVWVRNSGLEWLFRLISQPWRFRRQLALVEFMWLVMLSRLFL